MEITAQRGENTRTHTAAVYLLLRTVHFGRPVSKADYVLQAITDKTTTTLHAYDTTAAYLVLLLCIQKNEKYT